MSRTLETRVTGTIISLVDNIFHVQKSDGDFLLADLEETLYDVNVTLRNVHPQFRRGLNKKGIKNLLAQYRENISRVYVQKVGDRE